MFKWVALLGGALWKAVAQYGYVKGYQDGARAMRDVVEEQRKVVSYMHAGHRSPK